LKKYGILGLKIGISLAIIAFLVNRAMQHQAFSDLRDQPKRWEFLVLATLACTSAVLLTFVRWYYLVRALELPFRFKEALRLGFLGYLFNLAPMGIVGGDLLKAVMLARQQQDRRAQAVATVAVDRLIGLYVLFLVAAVAILATGLQNSADANVRFACQATLGLTALGAVGIAMLFIPGVTNGRVTTFLSELPRVGHVLGSLIDAVRMYRRKVHVLLVAGLMSAGVHSLFTVGVFLIACGLYPEVLSLSRHFVVMPISASMGVIPLPLGPFEAVLEFFYFQMGMPEGQGLIVALGYRLITLLIAGVGICYYWGSRRELAEVIEEAEHEGQPDATAGPDAAVSVTLPPATTEAVLETPRPVA
jgi:uncharacterized protein (TIRG00374 family)